MRVVTAVGIAFVFVSACGESRTGASLTECTSDLDCSEGESCHFASEAPRRSAEYAGGCRPSPPCGNCGPGQYCIQGCWPGGCISDCNHPSATPCADGSLCRTDGSCRPLRCDDSQHPGCPTGMTCDPTANVQAYPPGRYSLFGTDQYPDTDVDGGPVLTERQAQAVAASCVFLRCNESGAFDCAEGFRCDVESAPSDGSGCVGIACDELGACSSDAFICEPTSTGPRPAAVDAHGCASKNCEEGFECPASTECDFTRPGNAAGCAYLRCDEPGGSCPRPGTKCDPEPEPLPSGVVPRPDVNGCVTMHCENDGVSCPDLAVCAPADPRGGENGCAPIPEPPDAGAGGTGGGTATGGTGGGGAGVPAGGSSGSVGEAGATTTEGRPGVCR